MRIKAGSPMLARIVDTFLNIFVACWSFESERAYTFELISVGKYRTRASIFAWCRGTQIRLLAVFACLKILLKPRLKN